LGLLNHKKTSIETTKVVITYTIEVVLNIIVRIKNITSITRVTLPRSPSTPSVRLKAFAEPTKIAAKRKEK